MSPTPTTAEAAAAVNEQSKPANVIEAIARVMTELPGIGKDGQASAQQGGYAYRGIEAITGAAQKLLGRYGVVFVPRVIDRKTIEFTVNSKPWTEEQLTVEYQVYGPGGKEDSIVVGPLIALGRDNSDKGTNKAMTQAFKYALLQVLCVGDSKSDADGHDAPEADARSHDPEAQWRALGWADKAEHDAFRKDVEAGAASLDDEGRRAFKEEWPALGFVWADPTSADVASKVLVVLDSYRPANANQGKPVDISELREPPVTAGKPALCPGGCGWEPHNCRCPERPF